MARSDAVDELRRAVEQSDAITQCGLSCRFADRSRRGG